jgi:hypothetical protein
MYPIALYDIGKPFTPLSALHSANFEYVCEICPKLDSQRKLNGRRSIVC